MDQVPVGLENYCSGDTREKRNWKIGGDGPKMGPVELRLFFFEVVQLLMM